MIKLVSTTVVDMPYGQKQTVSNYVAEESPVENFTQHDTGADQEYYPGTLNTHLDGTPLIGPLSTEEEYKNSALQSAHNMGVVHATEITAVYPDPNFPAGLASPMGSDPDNPTLIKDRGPLIAQLGRQLAKDETFETSNITGLSHEMNPKSFMPDLNPYALMGDPRWSLGAAMQTMFQKGIPLITNFVKSITPLATYVNERGVICDADGNPIPTSQMDSALSFDVNGVIDYSRLPGTITKPPTVQELKKMFTAAKDKAFTDHADAFLKYLHVNFLDIAPRTLSTNPTKIALPWTAQPIYLKGPGMFFIKLTQEIIEKDPAMEVILVGENEVQKYRPHPPDFPEDNVIGQYIIEPDPEDHNGNGNRRIIMYFVYSYLGGYKEEKESGSAYNPYGYPDRDDPDAPAPPARPAVYEEAPGFAGKKILVSPAFPPGKPGRIETVDMNFMFKRYYPDRKEYIANALGVGLINANNLVADQKHIGALASLADPIPDYLQM